ncbi:Com family DNA-binding transcriptional regulator [Pseudomonas syringae]|nr:Com family DNA-binding transcriptional regulator [Pseudomonas syringae]
MARLGDHTELQIKCSRCGTLNHVKAASHELSPLSERGTAASLLPPSAI